MGDLKGARKQKQKEESGDARGAGSGRRRPRANDVGRALRSAYDETLREEIPDDFLDLLGKLS